MTKIKFLFFSIALVWANCSYCVEKDSKTCNAHCEFIALLTAQIAGGRDENMRGDLADDLAQYLQNYPKCGNDPTIVEDIVSFITDGNDAVKAGAVQALANIGPPAKAAVPALERALREEEVKVEASGAVMLPSRPLPDVIRNALDHIKGPARAEGKD